MQDEVVVPAGAGLSQGERLVDAFVAPSKTFTDILRSSSWWLPFVFMVLVGVVFSTAVDKKVGFDAVAQQQIEQNKFAADHINALPADQKAAALQKAGARTKMNTYLFPVFILAFAAIISLLWWASLNFGLGAKTKYSQIFAVWMYAALPKSVMSLLAAILLFAGVGLDNFNIQNPLGTNPGYYMDGTSALKAAASFIDVFGLWALALAVIGTAIVAGKKTSQTAIVVVGWWVVGLLLMTGVAAAFG